MTAQPAETPHGETVTHLGGYQLPYWDEDNGWPPGTPFPGRWVTASKHITGIVNMTAAFLDSGVIGNLAVWVGKTNTETGEMWRVWGLTDRPVSATLYRDKDDQVGIHAVFIPAKPAPVLALGHPDGLRWQAIQIQPGTLYRDDDEHDEQMAPGWWVIGTAPDADPQDGSDVLLHVDHAVDSDGEDATEATARALADHLNGVPR